MKLNFYRIQLEAVWHAFDGAEVRRSLAPLTTAIRGCSETIDRARGSGDEEFFEAVVENETSEIESHLGSAFVICQTFITAVVSRIMKLHDYHKAQSGAPLASTGGEKADIIGFGSPRVKRSPFTRVQVIDAFANYFKHREEWRGTWQKLTGRNAKTVEVIKAAGARQGSTGNLRTGAEALGNRSYEDLNVFAEILKSWKLRVWRAYSKELQKKGLL